MQNTARIYFALPNIQNISCKKAYQETRSYFQQHNFEGLSNSSYSIYIQFVATFVLLLATACKSGFPVYVQYNTLMIDKTAEDKWIMHYSFIGFVHWACLDCFFLSDDKSLILLHSSNKSMTVCLIKERGTSLKQHRATYKIFRWRRGRQEHENRAKRELQEVLRGEEWDYSHSATFSSWWCVWCRLIYAF